MTDLIYPNTPAHVIGDMAEASEMLPIVDGMGMVTAQASRRHCHYSGLKPMHPVVHLHLINRSGEIYLQRRSATKHLLPHYWDTAVGGHVSYGECIREALAREAGEELGLFDFNPIHLTTYIYENDRESELVFVFAAVGGYDPHPDLQEVEEGRWWPVGEIEDNIGKSVLTPNFESEFARVKDSLLALL